MKITYTPNPLETIIELDEHEKKELWYKLKIENLIDRLFHVHYELAYKKDKPDMEQILREVNPEHYMAEEGQDPVDRRADELLEYYVQALKDKHVGDCTCVPCSCDKCHAESMLGIDTIKGLGKHQSYKIDGAFKNTQNINEAIEVLRNYDKNHTLPTGDSKTSWDRVGGYESHIPRWNAEAAAALTWLEQYRNEHFSKD